MLYGHWQHSEKVNLSKFFGFLYEIVNNSSGLRYIGIKQLSFSKGRKSNWQTYTGSSKWLNEDIAKLGINYFTFNILSFAKDKASLKYMELDYMVKNNCLFDLNYYNQFIGIKIKYLKR